MLCYAVLCCVVLEKVKYELEENKGSESSKSRRIREWDKGEGWCISDSNRIRRRIDNGIEINYDRGGKDNDKCKYDRRSQEK